VRGYRRAWLRPDVIAGIVIWSVVTPQAVAYAQIAGLPPVAGLIAAPGALIGYALVGTSRTLVVSATTATSALSATAVGPLAGGDAAHFAALSAAFALVTGAVLVAGGALGLGSISDLVSKPVMTGFLFGLGLTITVGQLPAVLGLKGGGDGVLDQVSTLAGQLGDVHAATAAVGLGSIVLLLALRRLAPHVPGILVVLVVAIVVSALLGLDHHGVDVVGPLPSGVPDPAVPDVSWHDVGELVGPALGVMILSTEAVGVARAIATKDGYSVTPSRELMALGTANLLAGASSGFVQSGGASQTAAAQNAGGRSQLQSVVAAGLILLTGAFLAPLFTDLPQAALGAIVVVAVSGFFDVGELRRYVALRRSAIILAVVALAATIVLGILPGLLVAAGLSLVVVVQRLSRPPVGVLARDPATGAWGRLDVHPDWETFEGVLVARTDAPLWYGNAVNVEERVVALATAAEPRPHTVVLDLGTSPDLDVQGLDSVAELEATLARDGIALRLTGVHARTRRLLERAGIVPRVPVDARLDQAVQPGDDADGPDASAGLSPRGPRTPSSSRP
jgi:high affinity sulfate transporter 1